jgi:hypothetical protein
MQRRVFVVSEIEIQRVRQDSPGHRGDLEQAQQRADVALSGPVPTDLEAR